MNILNLENDWEELENDVDELATQIQVPKSKQSFPQRVDLPAIQILREINFFESVLSKSAILKFQQLKTWVCVNFSILAGLKLSKNQNSEPLKKFGSFWISEFPKS